MDILNEELGIIARHRVSKPYKRRIYTASVIAVVAIIGVGLPSGTHIWQTISVPAIAAVYFLYVIWQSKALETAANNKMKEWQSEISDQKA